MAKMILLNTVRSRGQQGPKVYTAGTIIDSTQVPTANITAVGGVLVAVGDASVATAQVIAQFRKLQGANPRELDAIMLGSGLQQLGIT